MLQAKISAEEQTEWSGQPPEEAGRRRSSPEHRRGLLLIGLFKLSKAALSIGLGVGALKLLHHDVATVVLRIADALKVDPESHLMGLIMTRADLIGATQLRHFSVLTFGYAALCLIEGTGLMLEKRWAEYFTVSLTVLALPWESWELHKEFTSLRIALLIVNLFVLVYLLWLLRRERRRRSAATAS